MNTHQQKASALQQHSHPLGETTTTVQQNTAYAHHAHELALSAATVVQTALLSKPIILALNATVEAARAGDQGGGVVASEVGNLAQSAATAAAAAAAAAAAREF